MKKSLIALTIATCLSAGAANAGTPLTGQEKIDYLKAELIAKGGVITNNDDFTKTITSPDGNHSITMDSNGVIIGGDYDGITIGDNHTEGYSHFLELVKSNTEVGIRPPAEIILDPIDPGFGVDPIDPGFGIDPIDPGFGVPEYPTPIGGVIDNDTMLEIANHVLSNQGEGDASLTTQKDGTVVLTWTDQVSGEVRHMNMNDLDAEQLEVVKTEFTDYVKTNAPIVDPIDPGFGVPEYPTPIGGVIDNETMIEIANHVLSNQGEGVASLTTQKDGTVVLTWTDQVSGETRHMNMNELDAEQLEVVRTGFANYVKTNSPLVEPIDPGFGIDPIDPGFGVPEYPTPIGGVIDNDTMFEIANHVLSNQGDGAQLTKDKNGNVQLVWLDQVSGEERKLVMNDLDAEQLEIVKTEFANYVKANAPIVDPIDPGFGIDPITQEDVLRGAGESLVEHGLSAKNRLTHEISGLNESVAMNSQQLNEIAEVAKSNANILVQGEMALLTAGSNLTAHLTEVTELAKNNANTLVIGEKALTDAAGNLMLAGKSAANQLGAVANNMETKLSSELASLQSQIDRLNSGDDGINPPTVDAELRAGLVVAKQHVEVELEIVANSAANNSMLIASTQEALKVAGQELEARGGKAVETLESARSGLNAGKNELTAALEAMQAQLDVQAALIAQLQNGETPQIPENGGTDLALVDGLKTASATLQSKLGKAENMLKKASQGLKDNKPQNGVQPITPTEPTFDPRDHEYGSVGNGAAKEWKTAQVDSGKAQMQEYLAGEFESFEQDLMNKFNSDMTAFQEDVQAEMDGVMASSHAISNSRPFLTNGGTAVGVGVGFSGDAQAVAIGVAHSFVDTGWSVSGSVNATTGSADTDVSAGAGVQYQF